MNADFRIGGEFSDLDHLVEVARAWNLDFYQLDRGIFRGLLNQVSCDGRMLAEARFSRALEQGGMPPPGLRTFAVPAASRMSLRWRGHALDEDSLMIFPRGGELFSISQPDFHVFTFSIPEDSLVEVAEELGIPGIARFLDSGIEVLRAGVGALSGLVKACREGIAPAIVPGSRTLVRQFDLIGVELLQVLIQARAVEGGAASQERRSRALDRARQLMERGRYHSFSVAELSREVGVSVRTLQYAFAEEFAMSPKSWLKARALNEVRRELRVAEEAEIVIADVANRWGFWHMGQFAADYRRSFGELPSETVRRSR